jgi:hypothetical protein
MGKISKPTREEAALRDFMRVLGMLREAHLALVNVSEEVPLLKEFCKIIVETGGYPFVWVGGFLGGRRQIFGRPPLHLG